MEVTTDREAFCCTAGARLFLREAWQEQALPLPSLGATLGHPSAVATLAIARFPRYAMQKFDTHPCTTEALRYTSPPVCYNAAMEDTQQGEEIAHSLLMTPALCAAIAKQYHLSLYPVRRLSGGEECEIWLTTSD